MALVMLVAAVAVGTWCEGELASGVGEEGIDDYAVAAGEFSQDVVGSVEAGETSGSK